MGTVNELLTVSRKQINVTEMPPSSNNVRYNTWYYGREVMGNGYPWCAVFIQWCFDQVKVKLPIRTSSCGDLMRAAQAAGCWVTRNFQPGDVVIYDLSGKQKTTQHCGIVEEILLDYGVQAIEGNTSVSGSQDNGGMVCRKSRASKYIIGAVRPKFDEEKKEDDMTGEEIYRELNNYLKKQPVPSWAKTEIDEAKKMGLTDGSDLMTLIPRYQAIILAKRAAQK